MKNDIIKYIDLILDAGDGSGGGAMTSGGGAMTSEGGAMTSEGGAMTGAITTTDVAKNLAKGHVDVIGGECPEGQTYDKKSKTCVKIEESIKGYEKGKPFGKKIDPKKMADMEWETMLKVKGRIRKGKHSWEYDKREDDEGKYKR